MTIETAPASLSGLRELEDHGQRGLVRETSLRAYGVVIDPVPVAPPAVREGVPAKTRTREQPVESAGISRGGGFFAFYAWKIV